MPVSKAGRNALLALALLVPAPSIGTAAAMVLWPGSLPGKALFAASKVWLVVLPVAWTRFVDRAPLGYSPVRHGGFLAGLCSGLVLSGFILAAYAGLGATLLDRAFFVARMREIGLGSLPVYVAGAAYWILINSVLEEYVWRWFVYSKCEALVRPAPAVGLAALCFTLHHYIALQSFCSWPVALAGSAGVFTAGAVWSFLYRRYRSIWPAYLSHALVDLCVFGIGAALLLRQR